MLTVPVLNDIDFAFPADPPLPPLFNSERGAIRAGI